MAISGSLEDVSVADVMQFIHLGRRTGTLMLHNDGAEATIGFHAGKLVSAKSPSTPKLGDLLRRRELIDAETLEEAVATQVSEPKRRSLGQILLAMEVLSAEDLRQVIAGQIEQTISELVHWDRGTFEFIVDSRRPVDDIALYPGDLVPDADINTQMVLLEAARIFDERNRDQPEDLDDPGDETHPSLPRPQRPGARATVETVGEDLDELGDDTQVSDPPEEEVALGIHRLQLVTSDRRLAEALSHALPPQFAEVEVVPLRSAGRPHPGHEPPIVVLDLRGRGQEGGLELEDLARTRRIRVGTPLVALVDPDQPSAPIYEAGAMAALPPEVEAIVPCVASVARNRRRSAVEPGGDLPAELALAGGQGVARLRRVFGDLRSGLISATVALNLMHIISESVERAVLLLVKRDELSALGAFGNGLGNRPLAELTRGLTLPLEGENALLESLERQEVLTISFHEANLPERFAGIVGPPANDQVVIFPVLGAQRVISLIYTDNGEDENPIEDIDILELATAQVGMAFENELLRRQISQQD